MAGLGVALLAGVTAPSLATAAPSAALDDSVKRIYIANDDHTDYMWSATDLQYRDAFLDMLDYYMDQAEATAGNPSDARGRFNCDGSLWVWEYEHNRSSVEFDRLIDHLRDGTITMPLQTAVPLYGAMPTEAVLRDMYYAGRLERRYGLRFPLALSMENQTMPGGVASLWAGAGALYSWKGICGCATRIDAADRPREIYRFQGPDGASVCMKWNTHFGGPTMVGGYAEAYDPDAAVSFLDSDPAFLSRWPWPVSGAFGHGGDHIETMTNAFVDAALTLSDSTRRVIVSNVTDFFEDFLSHHGNEIDTFSGGFGNEWDLYTASLGEVTASFKRQVEKLRTAEALATIASLLDPAFMNGRESVRDSAFLACGLFYEHDWTADGPTPKSAREQFQRDRLHDLERYVTELHDDALATVAAAVSQPGVSERHLVFNPLSWTRTDVAELAIDTPLPVRVVDVSTGLEVESEPVNGASDRIRILASDVPSVGYKVFEVLPGAGQSFPPSASVTMPTMAGDYYQITLDTDGGIVSVLDKKDGDRELVNAAGGGGLHTLGGGGGGTVTLSQSGPVSTTLSVSASTSPAHDTRVTLYKGVDRVDIEGVIDENFDSTVQYDFDFDLPGAVMRHEEVGMIARVGRAAQGGDYADEDTRTDYLTFNHFVDLSLPDHGITLSNWDSPFFKPGASTIDVLDASPRIRAVVGMQVDGSNLGIEAQGGDDHFLDRFALRSHAGYDPGAAMRFALEHQNPLVAARVTGAGSSTLPADQWSLVLLPSPDVLLWALKPAEEGIDDGIIARVWNVSSEPRPLSLSLPGKLIAQATRTTHVETDIAPAAVSHGVLSDSLAPQQLRTYRLITSQTVGVVERPTAGLALSASPNPARLAAPHTLGFALAAPAHVRLAIYDVRGSRIATLIDGPLPSGDHRVRWNGNGRHGEPAAPGVYFARIEAAGRTAITKLVRVR